MDDSRFLNSEVPMPEEPLFEALGHSGSDHYAGLETFDNPGCVLVELKSDEVVCTCPVTGQPDFYNVHIQLAGVDKLIESKSLKLWFQNLMRNSIESKGAFCESLAVLIREVVCEAVDASEEQVQVTLIQKSRGGISIKAVA